MNLLAKPKTLLVVLLVSLGLNCIAAGVLLAPVVTGKTDNRPLVEKVLKLAAKIPPELRQSIKQELRAHRDELRQAHDTVQDNREAIKQILLQPQLDEAALRAKLAEQRAAMDKVVIILQDGFVKILSKEPPEERIHLMQLLMKDTGIKAPNLRNFKNEGFKNGGAGKEDGGREDGGKLPDALPPDPAKE